VKFHDSRNLPAARAIVVILSGDFPRKRQKSCFGMSVAFVAQGVSSALGILDANFHQPRQPS
jgi:hypothetical protein